MNVKFGPTFSGSGLTATVLIQKEDLFTYGAADHMNSFSLEREGPLQ
jgi:hypothetical protein